MTAIFNWNDERRAFARFLASSPGILHIEGGDDHHARHFIDQVLLPSVGRPCVIDPHGQNLSALTALQSIVAALETPKESNQDPQITVNIGTNNRTRGNFALEHVHAVIQTRPPTEYEEIVALSRDISRHLDTTPNLEGLVVFFLDCQEHPHDMRKRFLISVFQPIVKRLLALGAHAVFQFSDAIKIDAATIPPPADSHIALPRRYDSRVAADITAYATREGWPGSEEYLRGRAATYLDLSPTVAVLYANIVKPRLEELESA